MEKSTDTQPESPVEEPIESLPEEDHGELGATEAPAMEQVSLSEVPAMEAETPLEGIHPIPPSMPVAPTKLLSSDERTWAMLAHLSVLLNLVTGFLGPVAAFIIYLVYRDRSRYVAYQSMQSLVLQLIAWIGAGFLIAGIWLVTGILSIVIIGLFLIPFAIIATVVLGLLPIASLVYGVYGAIESNRGADFRYWLVGDWVRGTYENPS
jgi:uncharacterized Tic20 family protein